MNRMALGVLIVVPFAAGLVTGSFVTTKLPATYENSNFGIRMRAPSVSSNGNGTFAMFVLEASEEFTPNVGIMAQPATPPLEYKKVTRSQFEQAGMKVVGEKNGKIGGVETVTWEYSGKVKERDLRFLQTALFTPDRVLLVTCTATPEQYKKCKDSFEETLSSMELTGQPK